MKLLIITSGFFPGKKYGGPPVSVNNFCSLLCDYECYIITRNHDLGESKQYTDIHSGWNKRENCKVLYLSDDNYNKNTYEKIIKEIQPDWIYLQSLFQECTFSCLRLAKKYKIHVMLAPRGELCAGALKKKYKKIPYIVILRLMRLLKNVKFQSTSLEETQAIKNYLNISNKDIYELANIPSIPREKYIHKIKGKGMARFIFLSRIHPKKNLLAAIQYLKHIDKDVVFDIYGSIENEVYWNKCKMEIEKLPDNILVRYCGLVTHDNVHRIFSEYDALLFPTLSENYGHVIVEALSVGTLVIVSDQTPWRDLEKYEVGWAISLDKKSEFVRALEKVIKFDNEEYSVKSIKAMQYVIDKLRLEDIKEAYVKAFERVEF